MKITHDGYEVTFRRLDAEGPYAPLPEGYDAVYNPCGYRKEDLHAVWEVEMRRGETCRRAALVGSWYAQLRRCALIEGQTLTVLQDDVLLQLDLESGALLRWTDVGDQGSYYDLYPLEGGYLVHGEVEIVKFTPDLEREWEFVGADSFVSADPAQECCRVLEDHIELVDVQGYHYQLDFDGYPL